MEKGLNEAFSLACMPWLSYSFPAIDRKISFDYLFGQLPVWPEPRSQFRQFLSDKLNSLHANFFQNFRFQKILSETLSDCQMLWIQIRTDPWPNCSQR